MYADDQMSITEIHKKTGIPLSNVRYALLKAGVLRARGDRIRIAAKAGKLGGGLRGKTREFSEDWKRKISESKALHGEENAKGLTKKPNGYIHHTRGENKGRGAHVVVMEGIIGRRLFANEVVHHIDENRSNNAPENLQLMTRAEHTRHHNIENAPKRKRNRDGKFE